MPKPFSVTKNISYIKVCMSAFDALSYVIMHEYHRNISLL
ncbi:hypothetical protein CUS_6912 [Ruminococcus albus 8]|uniref:Uncharacterized protein n=1 Tax=Ruminococcus albus 8 TaxID=246199 RepID=E9SHH8_RUMAL|nr:hypothetical protein CUS_6912 [Ruminococcus albus 8]